jgi:GcrA cell cycle regulator
MANRWPTSVWDDQRLTTDLMAMAADKRNTREMARDLSEKYGMRFTRNMIIGRARREGIELNTNRCGGHPRPKRSHKAKGDANKVVKFRQPPTFRESSAPMPIPPLLITYADLQSHHCREIIDTDKALSCGHPKQAGSSFCPHHHSINWMPPTPATRRQFVFGGKAA